MAKYKMGHLLTVPFTAGGSDIAADDVVVLGRTGKLGTVGVAMKNIAANATEDGAVAATGVFRFPKVAGAVIRSGESVNWDASAGAVDDNAATPATGDVAEFGKAMQEGADGDTEIDVMIDQRGTVT